MNLRGFGVSSLIVTLIEEDAITAQEDRIRVLEAKPEFGEHAWKLQGIFGPGTPTGEIVDFVKKTGAEKRSREVSNP